MPPASPLADRDVGPKVPTVPGGPALRGTLDRDDHHMAPLHVDSEVGRLRSVLLHRPDLELRRLTPSNCHDLLFDDVLWVKRARQEHDAFADTLARPRHRGARRG